MILSKEKTIVMISNILMFIPFWFMSVHVSVSIECTYDRVLFIMMSTTTFLSSASRLVALVNGEFDPQIYVSYTLGLPHAIRYCYAYSNRKSVKSTVITSHHVTSRHNITHFTAVCTPTSELSSSLQMTGMDTPLFIWHIDT